MARNDLARAVLTNIPITPRHTLILPIRHVSRFSEATNNERIAMFDLAQHIANTLTEKFGAEGFNYAWNEGKAAGQNVEHLHLHIVPRTEGDTGIYEYDPRKFLYRPGSREISPQDELLAAAEELRNAINS
ncbi:MAG: HIT family protein [Candidatus Kaiserbacteria bacterium]|nr:HIT family protein [Candidatus Kaiserbacteria bacterium]